MEFVVLVIDSWTQAKTQKHFFGVEVIGMVQGQVETRFLEFERSCASETGEAIASQVQLLLADYGIDEKRVLAISSDSGANKLKTAKILGIPSIPCSAHILHNIVVNTFKSVTTATELMTITNGLIAHFKRSSKPSLPLLQTMMTYFFV